MINEYKLVETGRSSDLEKRVIGYLDQGYRLHGPLVVTREREDVIWLRQVVVKGPNT